MITLSDLWLGRTRGKMSKHEQWSVGAYGGREPASGSRSVGITLVVYI